MPKIVSRSPKHILELKAALVSALKAEGMPARVREEKVPGTKLYRLYVLSPGFRKMWHSERQDLAWRITEKVLKPDHQFCISMIITMTPDEMKG